MTIEAGTKLGYYEIRSKIGEGGMGEVYLAQDTKLDRKVALKILVPHSSESRRRNASYAMQSRSCCTRLSGYWSETASDLPTAPSSSVATV